jgi:hypothetical protein
MNDNANPNGVGEPLPEANALSPERWREICQQLLVTRDQLRAENAEFRKQSQQLMDMWFPEDAKPTMLSKEELFAQCATQPTLREVVDRLTGGEL